MFNIHLACTIKYIINGTKKPLYFTELVEKVNRDDIYANEPEEDLKQQIKHICTILIEEHKIEYTDIKMCKQFKKCFINEKILDHLTEFNDKFCLKCQSKKHTMLECNLNTIRVDCIDEIIKIIKSKIYNNIIERRILNALSVTEDKYGIIYNILRRLLKKILGCIKKKNIENIKKYIVQLYEIFIYFEIDVNYVTNLFPL